MKKLFLCVIALPLSFQIAASEIEGHTDIHDVMAYVLDPAAEAIWDSAGYVITEEGEVNLAPTDQEGWDKVKMEPK